MSHHAPVNREPHVAIFTNNPIAVGGMQKFSRQLIEVLIRSGCRVTVGLSGRNLYADQQKKARQLLTIAQLDWLDATMAGDRTYRRSTIAKRLRWFRRSKPDLAIFIQSSNTPFRSAVVAARLAGVPSIVTHRTLPWPIDDVGSKRYLFGLLPGLGLYRKRSRCKTHLVGMLASRIVYNCQAVRCEYENIYHYPARKGVVIPNALDDSWFSKEKKQKPQASHPLVIGYAGRLGAEKRVDVLIRAFAAMNASHPTELHLYGEGPSQEELATLTHRLEIAHRVQFKGAVRASRAAYAPIDIFVMPSDRESSSNAVLEAMASGKPLVVTDVGGLPELVERGPAGLVVPHSDVNAMTEALDELVRSEDKRHQLAARGQQRAREEHRLDAVGDRWVQLVRETARQSRTQKSTARKNKHDGDGYASMSGHVIEGHA